MMRSLWTAASGMNAQQFNIDVIANNMANVNTAGFKKSRVDFQDLLYQTIRAAGAPITTGAQIPTGIQVGHGVRPAATQKIFTPGVPKQTENPLDLMISGDGFFQIQMPDGTIAYTRDGSFKKDSTGRLVTSDGFPIVPEIYIPEDTTEITISDDGSVWVKRSGQANDFNVGQIELVRFANPAGLENLGRNLLQANAASGQPMPGIPGLEGYGSITQGFLELSNVQIVQAMVDLIVAQRAYETNSKAIQASDDMLQTANNLRR